MQNNPRGEEEKKNFDEIEAFFDKNLDNKNLSTKVKDFQPKESDEDNSLKDGEDCPKCNDAKIINLIQMNKFENIDLRVEQEKIEDKLQNLNLNDNQNLFADKKEENNENLISRNKKVNENNFSEKIENKKNKFIIKKPKHKKKKKNRRAKRKKKAVKKNILLNQKKEEDKEIVSNIIDEIVYAYEHPKINSSIQIPILPFEKIKSPFDQNSQVDNDEILTEEAFNICCNHPRFNAGNQAMIIEENTEENLFDLQQDGNDEINWVDFNAPTNEVL